MTIAVESGSSGPRSGVSEVRLITVAGVSVVEDAPAGTAPAGATRDDPNSARCWPHDRRLREVSSARDRGRSSCRMSARVAWAAPVGPAAVADASAETIKRQLRANHYCQGESLALGMSTTKRTVVRGIARPHATSIARRCNRRGGSVTDSEIEEDRDHEGHSRAGHSDVAGSRRGRDGRASRRTKMKGVTVVVVWRSTGTVAHWEWFTGSGSRTGHGGHLCARRVADLARQFPSPDYAVIAERIIVKGPVVNDLAAHPTCPGGPVQDVTGDWTGAWLHARATKMSCSTQAVLKNPPGRLAPCVSSEFPRSDASSCVAAGAALDRVQTQAPILKTALRDRRARSTARRRSE